MYMYYLPMYSIPPYLRVLCTYLSGWSKERRAVDRLLAKRAVLFDMITPIHGPTSDPDESFIPWAIIFLRDESF